MYFKHGILNQTNMFHNIFFFIADSPSVVMDMPPTGGSQWFELITGSNPVANSNQSQSTCLKKNIRKEKKRVKFTRSVYSTVAKIEPKESLTYIKIHFNACITEAFCYSMLTNIYVLACDYTYRNILPQLQTQKRALSSTSCLHVCIGQ